jgi:hypothetical protein
MLPPSYFVSSQAIEEVLNAQIKKNYVLHSFCDWIMRNFIPVYLLEISAGRQF